MGYYINILDLFNRMLRDGVHPNTITFTLLLNSCSCLSLVDARQTYFETVSKDYGTIFRFGHQLNTIGFHGFEERVTMVKEAVGKLLSSSSPVLLSLLVDTFKRIAVLPFQHVISRDESFCAVSESQEDAVLSELKKTERKQWTNSSSGHDKGSAFMSLSPQPLLVMHNKDGNSPRNPGELLVCQSQHFNEEGIIKRSSEYRIPGYGHNEINGSIMASGESVKELPPLNELTFCNANYQELQQEMVLSALIKACTCERDLPKGSRLHANILKSGLLKNIIISNALLNMYVKCGAFIKARHIFAELANRNVVSWTTLIAGYCEHGHDEEARKCFDQMKLEGLIPDAVTLGCILKAFGSREMMPKGQEIHVEAVRGGLLEQRTLIGNALVHMYAKCGALGRAQEVFNKLLVQDVTSWTALITGYSEHGQGHEALHYFEQMKLTGLSPNAVTYISISKACGTLENVEKGKEIHAEILREGLLEKNNVLNTGLVHMYAKCGMLQKAQGMFDEIPDQNVVSWNTLIAGYCHYGQIDKAFDCFKNMKQMGVSPDSVTFTCLLKACGSKRSVRKGDELYKEIFHSGLLQNSVLLGNAVVDMYTKGGELAKAQQVFEELPNHSLASWTSLIAGYCQRGHCEEALNYFEQMKNEGFSPDVVTFACALKACGTSGAIEKGEEIYLEIVREGLLEKFGALGNALVNMYAKCGAVVKAQEVFNKLPAHDIISWTALITGYCEHGHCEKAFSCFELMKFEGFSPDTVTLSVILKACSNIGAADTSLGYLEMVM
ncbi:hypothetical protein KP509_30G023200 [Ceratopteris richardii]|uniref:Pentatricopeptide repeat-containing protein n=1 Tax=Ceratopteris richardii TaxID=49495 RepID=A0A8T2R1T0_CERRI|nr:hypothetical protein KP509_30G023200 [Ceratopteris richardii]